MVGQSGVNMSRPPTQHSRTIALKTIALFSNADMAHGGAIYARLKATANNSTFTGNQAGGYGGAIFAGLRNFAQAGTIVANNSLFLGNAAIEGSNEIDTHIFERRGVNVLGDLALSTADNRTIRSAQTGSGSHFEANPIDVFASVFNIPFNGTTYGGGEFGTSGGFDAGCSGNIGRPGVLSICTPELVQTIPLDDETSNPAIDRTKIFGVDQRGISRLSDFPGAANGGFSDIGAFEVTPPNVVTTHLISQPGQTDIFDAINWADDNSGTSTITFAPHLSGRTITVNGDVDIDVSVIIDASALSNPVTIQGNGSDRIFEFRASTGDMTINNLILQKWCRARNRWWSDSV